MPDMPASDAWSGTSGPGSPAPVIHSAQLSTTLQELDNLQAQCFSSTSSARFSQIQNHCDYLQSTIASIRAARQHTTENVIESTAESARAQVNEYALVRMQGRISRRQSKQDRAIQKVSKRANQVENQQRYQLCRALCTGIWSVWGFIALTTWTWWQYALGKCGVASLAVPTRGGGASIGTATGTPRARQLQGAAAWTDSPTVRAKRLVRATRASIAATRAFNTDT